MQNEKQSHGILYGVGMGPGDPELLTLKAVRIIEESPVLAVPGRKKEETIAYQIAEKAGCSFKDKEFLEIHMPMTKDKDKLAESHAKGAEQIIECLKQGKQVAFLTLGDPTIYSTYMYLHRLVAQAGFETRIISGITSFCAASARLQEGLVDGKEELHIIPSSYGIREALELKGTKVLMKAGKKMPEIKRYLAEEGFQATMVENCGMEQEKVYKTIEEIPEEAGYYSLLIVKGDRE